MPLVYEGLKRLAAKQMGGRNPSRTLSPTGLVHDLFLRLHDAGELAIRDRIHFFAVAAQTMRWLLADEARAKGREKRGGKAPVVAFDENFHSPLPEAPLVELDAALAKLQATQPRLCRIVELRHLAGLSIEETALALGISPVTVARDWKRAQAWLVRELSRTP
jgi:RNA polymerase sigma factor (TIGR02999 family)